MIDSSPNTQASKYLINAALIFCSLFSFASKVLFGLSDRANFWGYFNYTASVLLSLACFVALRLIISNQLSQKGLNGNLMLKASFLTAFASILPILPDGFDVFYNLAPQNWFIVSVPFFVVCILLIGALRFVGFFVAMWSSKIWQVAFGKWGRRTCFLAFVVPLVLVEALWLVVFPLFGFVSFFVPGPASWQSQSQDQSWVAVDPSINREGREFLSGLEPSEAARRILQNLPAGILKSETPKTLVFPETFLNVDPTAARIFAQEFYQISGHLIWFGIRYGVQNLVSVSAIDPVTSRFSSGIAHQKTFLVPFFERRFWGLQSSLVGLPFEVIETDFEDEMIPPWFWNTGEEGLSPNLGLSKSDFFICYDALNIQAIFGAKSKAVLVLTNHESFSRFSVLSKIYDSHLRWLGALAGKTMILASNEGSLGLFGSDGFWVQSKSKDLADSESHRHSPQQFKMTRDWWK